MTRECNIALMISLIILTSVTAVSLSGVRTSLLPDAADERGEFLVSSDEKSEFLVSSSASRTML